MTYDLLLDMLVYNKRLKVFYFCHIITPIEQEHITSYGKLIFYN
jgi:hypothetical protein